LMVRIWLQVGSADHHIHYFDLRKPQEPLFVFTGHKKAVSYVKFINDTELASASTDSTLRLWDVKENCLVSRLVLCFAVLPSLCAPVIMHAQNGPLKLAVSRFALCQCLHLNTWIR
jgi:WD40 repeat protein